MKKESNDKGGVALLQRSNAIKEGVVRKQMPRHYLAGHCVYGGISLQQHEMASDSRLACCTFLF